MTVPSSQALVHIRDLSFTYPGTTTEVLRIPFLDIRGRGLIAITGPSGAGKSTLIELMAGTLREPYGGSLQVLGHEWKSFRSDGDRQRLLRRIGLIPQDYGLLTNRTPRQMLGQDLADAQVAQAQRSARVNDALAQVGMDQFADRPIGQLSGGQRQRVAIARMLARDVELVIADEPTANLDRDLTWQTVQILRQLAEKVPVLVITHEPEVAEACDRTIVLQALASPATEVPTAQAVRRRRTPWLVAAFVLLLIAAAGIVAVATHHGTRHSAASKPAPIASKVISKRQVVPSPDTSVSASPASSPAPAAVPVTSALLLAAGACTAPCTITGTVPFTDPVDGPSTFVTILNSIDSDGSGDGFLASVSNGRVTWYLQLPSQSYETLAPAPVSIDKTGHIFINFNPGRYNGVIVLNPIGNSFNDYGSLPSQDGLGRFYSGDAVDPTHSGINEIQLTINNCAPDCADGTYIQTTYHWNGNDYVQ